MIFVMFEVKLFYYKDINIILTKNIYMKESIKNKLARYIGILKILSFHVGIFYQNVIVMIQFLCLFYS